MQSKNEIKRFRFHSLVIAISGIVAGLPVTASAYEIDVGNPDISINWNNTIRYNWARRMQSIDEHVALAGPAAGTTYNGYGAGDYLFDEGDTITNRLDLLSEFNFNYAGKYGFRVSAAAWYDAAYDGKHPTPAQANLPFAAAQTTSYQGNEFTHYVKRYYEGPSAEWLDAYVFGNFDLDGSDLNVRLGRHAVVWGEGLVGSNHSVAYSQAPSDSRKSVSSPGASAKETALPVQQVSATYVINPEFTLLGHYQFEWVPNRVPEAGTYFAPGDVVLWGPNVNRNTEFKRGEHGGYGLGLKWSPEWLDGTLGFYHRKFDDKGGWLAQITQFTQAAPGAPATFLGGNPFNTTSVWAKDVKLYGVTLSKSVAGVSVGAEFSYREDGPLSSAATASAGSAGNFEGAVGDTYHGLLNGVWQFGSSPAFDTATFISELAWAKLHRFTRNGQLYKSAGNAADCISPVTRDVRGCSNGDFLGMTLIFTPSWLQVYPGVDLAAPLLYSENFGNSPSAGAGSKGFVTYKAGLTATVLTRHIFDLSYTWWDQMVAHSTPFTTGGANASGAYGRLLGPPYSDKGFLSFTYQATF